VIRSRRLTAVAAILFLAAGLVSCAGTVSLQPAANADDPGCASVMVRLPSTIAGEQRRWTDAQATAAWGSPTAIIMTCGVDVPGPTTEPCTDVSGVFWLVDESEAPKYRFTTFGRTPAVEVYLDFDVVGSADTLRALSPVLASQLEETGQTCTPRPGS
jgi:hypothetical protein